MTDNKWISTIEAADLIGVSPQTVRRMIQDHNLPVLRVGNRIKIERREFLELIDDLKTYY